MERKSDWNTLKTVALSQFKQPSGSTLVTSFTSSQPLHGWTRSHALRELWQNFKDGFRGTFGRVKFSRDTTRPGYYVATTVPEWKHVGSVDCRDENVLSIEQHECILTIENLQLASMKGGEREIGGHGEGFKLGINLLLREGFQVKYIMPGQNWEFKLCNTTVLVYRTCALSLRLLQIEMK